jgi:hypothetical protein
MHARPCKNKSVVSRIVSWFGYRKGVLQLQSVTIWKLLQEPIISKINI